MARCHGNPHKIANHKHDNIRRVKLVGKIFCMAPEGKIFRLNIELIDRPCNQNINNSLLQVAYSTFKRFTEASPAMTVDLPSSTLIFSSRQSTILTLFG
jgi:hypothetical protein